MKWSVILFVVLFFALALFGCSKPQEEEAEPEEKVVEPEPEIASPQLSKMAMNLPEGTKVAVIEMERGNIELELFSEEMPKTTGNFIKLADEGFFDRLKWHRVVPGQLIQSGDPTGKGGGGPGYDLEFEESPIGHQNAGIIAMAKRGDIISGSQFYITLIAMPSLDEQEFEPFGKIVTGSDVAKGVIVGDIIERIVVVEVGGE